MISVYDDGGTEIQDEVRRERYMLYEESERIKLFLADVSKMVGVESEGIGDFHRVVKCLEQLRIDDSDLAPDAERLLNRAAAIDLDICRHLWYIQRKGYPIDQKDYFS